MRHTKFLVSVAAIALSIIAFSLVGRQGFQLIGAIPENPELGASRTIDVVRQLGAKIIHEGDLHARRVRRSEDLTTPDRYAICARSNP